MSNLCLCYHQVVRKVSTFLSHSLLSSVFLSAHLPSFSRGHPFIWQMEADKQGHKLDSWDFFFFYFQEQERKAKGPTDNTELEQTKIQLFVQRGKCSVHNYIWSKLEQGQQHRLLWRTCVICVMLICICESCRGISPRSKDNTIQNIEHS